MSTGLYSGASGIALGVGLYRDTQGLWGGATGLMSGFAGSSPYSGSSLYLDFLTPSLDSRVTFTRGSNATLVDSTGKITYAPANLLLRSQEFDNAGAWTLEGTTLSGGQIAPDGTATAYLFTATAPSGNRRITQVISQVVSVSYVRSIYIRRVTGTGAINLRSPTGSDVDITSQISATWNRISVSGTATGASNFILAFSVTGDAIEIWGSQVEPVTYQTTPSTYVATTSAAYYGPRFDYNPVTLAPKGLLIEEQRTNVVLYSEQFDNAAWQVLSGATKTANTTVSPDGTTNADTITATSSSSGVYQTQTASNSTVYTTAAYFKAGTGSEVRFGITNQNESATTYYAFTLSGSGSFVSFSITGFTAPSASITSAGNGWYRCVVTATSPSTGTTAVGPMVRLSAAGTLFAYGAQLEAGSFATSYIPTVASQVTRSADVATMTGTNFSSWYNQSEGTLLIEALLSPDVDSPSGNYYVTISDGTASNSMHIVDVSGTVSQVVTSGVTQFSQTVGAEPTGILKAALAYAANNTVSSANGAIGATDTSVSIPTVNRLSIGSTATLGSPLCGHIRTIVYYNTRLPNAQLQALTAPSLVTTLSMSFTDQAYTVGV